jgi:protoporphyrinogen oxidase
MKACVIGAGSSGIAAAKALRARGIALDSLQVDYDDYLFDLRRERRRGASRA